MEIYKVDAGQACPLHEWKKLKPYKTKNSFLQQKISNFHTMGQKQYFSDDICNPLPDEIKNSENFRNFNSKTEF